MIHSRRITESKEDYFDRILVEENHTYPKELTRAEKKKLRVAFELAHDIRKFEIELFWKRATHFWIFISVIFAGYGTLWLALLKDSMQQGSHSSYQTIGSLFLLLLNVFGFVLSWVWVRVMMGSKFWQENWESHIDFLEPFFSGQLHKTVFYKDESKHYSVSALSRAVGYLFLLTWSLVYLCSAWTFLHHSSMSADINYIIIMSFLTLNIRIIQSIDTNCVRYPEYKNTKSNKDTINGCFLTKLTQWKIRFRRFKNKVIYLWIILSLLLLVIPWPPKTLEFLGPLFTILIAICACRVVYLGLFSQTS